MKKVLYLGIECPTDTDTVVYTHFPLIKTIPRDQSLSIINAFSEMNAYTHLLFTSKSAIQYFFTHYTNRWQLNNKCILAIGTKTAEKLTQQGYIPSIVSSNETSEGIIEVLENLSLNNAYLFWPHSALSRPVISDYLNEKHIKHCELILYDTLPNLPAPFPDIEKFDEFLFTSPSTVDAFLNLIGPLPKNVQLTPIGPITSSKLLKNYT